MAAVVKIIFSKDVPPYQAQEEAAFTQTRAVELVGQRNATFSSNDDAVTYAADVSAYQAAHDRPVPISMFVKPNGTLGSTRAPGAPNFGQG